MSRLAYALDHIEYAHTEGEYIPCPEDCSSCQESCPCRKGYRKESDAQHPDEYCSKCYTEGDPDGINARDRAILELARHGRPQRSIAYQLACSQATVSRVLALLG
jgi:hypothetical protein